MVLGLLLLGGFRTQVVSALKVPSMSVLVSLVQVALAAVLTLPPAQVTTHTHTHAARALYYSTQETCSPQVHELLHISGPVSTGIVRR